MDDDYATTQTKRNWLSETNVKLITALIALAAGILNFFGRSQRAMWVIGIGSALLLTWLLGPSIFALFSRIRLWYGNKKYLAREYPALKRMFDRLSRFTSRDDSRSFRNMLYSASAYRHDVIDQILGSDYIEEWLKCFAIQLASSCGSVYEFMCRCREFTTIVTEYNKNYIIKTQKSLERAPADLLPEYTTDQFEEFRERFSAYLNEVEQWADSVAVSSEKRVHYDQFLQGVPHRHFDRVKSFKKAVAKVTVQKS